jgi:hypothetical protein
MTIRAETPLSGLVEAVPDAIVGVNACGVIVLINSHAERLFRYEPGALLGRPVDILVPPSSRGPHPAHRTGYFAEPHARPMGAGMELAALRQDGTEFPAEISLSAIETDQGLIVTAAIRDVSDRQRADRRFRGLLEAAPDAMICVDESGEIALMNAQAERLFGYSRDELVGKSVDLLVPDSVRDRHPAFRQQYFEDPSPRPMGAGRQLVGRRKDGSEFPAEISLSALETSEGVLVSAAVRDVSDRLEAQAERDRLKAQADQGRLERQLQQSQRLESLGQLAGGVAHDFNNLLAVIGNYATFIGEEVSRAAAGEFDRPWESVQSDIEQIQEATERAARLTHQLLAFARREIVRPEILNLNVVATELGHLLHRSIGEQIELVTVLAPDLWSTVADPGQIEQVLVNLAVNARDAMPGGGNLVIDTTNVEVDDEYMSARPSLPPGRYVRLRVSDTGTGMEPDVVERAFEPFYSTKPKDQGTGLGLATVYGIISQANGYAHIYSEPGLGTTISVLLPATDMRAEGKKRAAEAPDVGRGETILIAEDEDGIREVSRRILERNGYHVMTAANGVDALRVLAEHRGVIHMLLTDVVMPRMLGKDLAERARRLHPSIRVLYMSGYAQLAFSTKAPLGEDIHLLEKPFSQSRLLADVRQVLDGPE